MYRFISHSFVDEVAFDVSGSRHGESDEYFQFGRPGGGAPVKDQNGKLAAKRGMGPQRQVIANFNLFVVCITQF